MFLIRHFSSYILLFFFAGLLSQRGNCQTYPLSQKILAGDGEEYDAFGYAASISSDGKTAIVGATYDLIGAIVPGSAYIYIRNTTTNAWTQQAKLVATDAADEDRFGYSASISANGNTAVVGAWGRDNGANTDQGAVYIFTRNITNNTWSQQAKLVASDGSTNDYFGWTVAISGDGNTVIVGAYPDDVNPNDNKGSTYIFTRSGNIWAQQARLLATSGNTDDFFGYSVAINTDGNTAIIGAIDVDATVTNQGAAYIFTRSGATWSQQARLVAIDAAANDFLGWSVSISGDGNTAVVGSNSRDNGANTNQGAAYIFTRSGTSWSQQARLLASDGAANDGLGSAVAISADGNAAVVGAYSDDNGTANPNQGAAYVYTRSGSNWTQQTKLVASDGAGGDAFAYAVSINYNGGIVLASANNDQVGTQVSQGSAYIYTQPLLLLPVHITEWVAAKQGNNGILNWKVVQEENITTYIIERSSDGRSFIQIGSVASSGNITAARNYNFTDGNPLTSNNYYRLKITEKDGKVSYSDIRLLNFGSQISLALYPNPVKDNATLTGVETGMCIRIQDVVGKVVRIQPVTSTTETITLNGIAKGLYTVQVFSANGILLNKVELMKE